MKTFTTFICDFNKSDKRTSRQLIDFDHFGAKLHNSAPFSCALAFVVSTTPIQN